MLISLQAAATRLVISVESLFHVELFRRLRQKTLQWSTFGQGEEGSLHQLCAQPAGDVWDWTYSGGNSVHIDSKCI